MVNKLNNNVTDFVKAVIDVWKKRPQGFIPVPHGGAGYGRTHSVYVVPPASALVREPAILENLSENLRHPFGSQEFMAVLNDLASGYTVEDLYRTSAMLILVRERVFLYFLTGNDEFIGRRRGCKRIGKTLASSQEMPDSGIFMDSVDHGSIHGAYLNVVTMVESGPISGTTGDLLMVFGADQFLGAVYAYMDTKQEMIGIRSSMARLAHTSNEYDYLKGSLGDVLFAVRCYLAHIDGYDHASISNPIGGMRRKLLKLRKNEPLLAKVLLGRESFRSPDVGKYYKTKLQPWLDNMVIHVPNFRDPISFERGRVIMGLVHRSTNPNRKRRGPPMEVTLSHAIDSFSSKSTTQQNIRLELALHGKTESQGGLNLRELRTELVKIHGNNSRVNYMSRQQLLDTFQ